MDMDCIRGKKIMVVGGAGFIGSHVANRLVKIGAIVSVVDNLFLGNKSNLDPVFFDKGLLNGYFRLASAGQFEVLQNEIEYFKPDVVINLAVVPLIHSIHDPSMNFKINTRIVVNLLELLRLGKYSRLIHFSSSEVYGSAKYAPMDESHPLEASTPYAASKAACDVLVMSYVKTFGCNAAIIRPFNNYGPKQNDGSYAGVIPLTINRILNNKEPVIEGSGEQTRDYIFVEDTVDALLQLIKKDTIYGEIFNVASGHDVSIKWLMEKICSLMNYGGNIKYLPERCGDVHRHIANTLKAKDILGFNHTTGMHEGLKKTIDWYLIPKAIR